MPPERTTQQSTTCSKDNEKELKRVYRKLKGVRSELSVKMRRLRKEYTEGESEMEDNATPDDLPAIDSHASGSEDVFRGSKGQNPKKCATDIAQCEVKSLIDHKNRLRKRFWKLREEVRK